MFRKLLIGVLVFSFLFLFGCASHIPLSKENARSIKSVYVKPGIKKPNNLFIETRADRLGFAFGGILGLALASSLQKSETDRLQVMAAQGKLHVDDSIYEQWVNNLSNKSSFKVSKNMADVILETEIDSYGIRPAGAFSFDYAPSLMVTAKLLRNNQVIWQDTEFAYYPAYDLPTSKFEAIANDPQRFNAMLNKAVDAAVTSLLNDMNKHV